MKILVVQNRMGIGDMVIFLPFIEAISKKFNSPINILVKENSKALEYLEKNKYIEKILILERNNNNSHHDGIIGSFNLANDLKKAASFAGEGIWRMPMPSSYKDGLKSMLADIKNTGPRPGGSITAALFLKEFVQESISWAHIDIAGPVWSEKDRGLDPAGATGYGVRTLVNWICQKPKQNNSYTQ